MLSSVHVLFVIDRLCILEIALRRQPIAEYPFFPILDVLQHSCIYVYSDFGEME